MAKLVFLLYFSLCLSVPLAVAQNTEEVPQDPAVVQFCVKRDFYNTCGLGTGVFISSNQVLTAYHVISPILQTKDSIKDVLFFRHPKQPHTKVQFNRVITTSAIDDVAILEVADYTSEDFYPLMKREEENTSSIGDEGFLKGFPKSMKSRFTSLPVSIIDSNQYNLDHYMVVDHPNNYNLRGMSGGPMLIDGQLVGIVSNVSTAGVHIALVDEDKINHFEPCNGDDSFCVRQAMQDLQTEATQENVIAQYLLSMKYYFGVETEKDDEKALYWHNRALLNDYSEEG